MNEDGSHQGEEAERLIKIGAKVVSHCRYITFQMAEVVIVDECSRRFCG
jgi:hypothetical protein